MRKVFVGLLAAAVVAFTGCNQSPTGGRPSSPGSPGSPRDRDTPHAGIPVSPRTPAGGTGEPVAPAGKDEIFRLTGPVLATDIKQGETKTIKIDLKRGRDFKDEVTLSFSGGNMLKFDPATPEIKASEKGEVEVKVTAAKDAPLGKQTIKVTGKPSGGGAPTTLSVDVNVKESK